MNNKWWILITILAVAFIFFITKDVDTPGQNDELAQCLTSQGVKMYGAYWCPHCQDQKDDFGASFTYIDYIECAIQGNPRAKTQVCEEANIQGYPTWEFSDGSRLQGYQELQILAEKVGC